MEEEIDRLNAQDKVIVVTDNVNSATTNYLKKRIRVVQDPHMKKVYMLELERLNKQFSKIK